MTRRELLKLCLKPIDDGDDKYFKSGLDDTCRIFLHCIRENENHKRRQKIFEKYSGYESQY